MKEYHKKKDEEGTMKGDMDFLGKFDFDPIDTMTKTTKR